MKKIILAFNLALFLVACQKNDDTVLSKENKVGQSDPGDYSKYQNGSCNPTLKNTVGVMFGSPTPPCFAGTIHHQIEDSTAAARSYPQIDLDALYGFRDNFLASSGKGIAYHDYYYKISDFILKYQLNETSFTDAYQTLLYAVEVSNRIAATNNNGVIVDDEIYNFLKAKSAQIHQNAHYSEISSVIYILDKDLEELRGKDKAQFIDFFNQAY